MRVWHQWVLVPSVLHALVALMEVYVALPPYRFFLVPFILVMPWVMPVLLLLLLIVMLVPLAFSLVLVAVLVVQVDEWLRLSPAVSEVLKILRAVLTAHVTVMSVMLFSVARVSVFVLFVIHGLWLR